MFNEITTSTSPEDALHVLPAMSCGLVVIWSRSSLAKRLYIPPYPSLVPILFSPTDDLPFLTRRRIVRNFIREARGSISTSAISRYQEELSGNASKGE